MLSNTISAIEFLRNIIQNVGNNYPIDISLKFHKTQNAFYCWILLYYFFRHSHKRMEIIIKKQRMFQHINLYSDTINKISDKLCYET